MKQKMNVIRLFICLMALSLIIVPSGLHADVTTNFPTTATGGTGTVADLQTDNDVNYTVAKGQTAIIGGFDTYGGAITSVYLFVQYTVDTGYSGTGAIRVNGVNTPIVPATRDYGRWAYIDITGGSFGVDTSAEISSLSVTFDNNHSGTGKSVFFDCVYVVVNPQTPISTPPTWSEDFNGTGQANPMIWDYEVGYQRNSELQYYVAGAANGWQEGGNFVIEGRKEVRVDPVKGTMNYTSASIVSYYNFYWQYGRAQIRAKIPCLPGMWPAIWGCGYSGEWPSNGEVDIMEYNQDRILANTARSDGIARWGSTWDDTTPNRSIPSLTAVDPNWKTQWHIWTMQWDQQNVRLYVDNVLMGTVPQTFLVNPNTTWGPKEPFQQPFCIWLNLAMGGTGGDPTATMNSGPQRYLIDYWKIWEGATNNVAPTNITLSANTVEEGLPVGTLVGNLLAEDADPAEVFRYTLVAGAGDTHNSQFTIPEFVSDTTTLGALKTKVVLNAADGTTRSVRVQVTDIEGATFATNLTINVRGREAIDITTNTVSIAEGGTANFNVKLRILPATTVTVNVARVSGDTDLSVNSTNVLYFTPANGTNWQQVVLAAAHDADKTNGVAVFSCTDAGGVYSIATVTAYESDDDNLPPVVDAGTNQTVSISEFSAWTPVAIAPATWYDASEGATVTTNASGYVSQWSDKSGNAHHAVQAGGTTVQPARQMNQLNGLPTVYFDGGDSLAAAGSNAVRNLFVVCNASGTTFLDWRWVYGTKEGTDVPALFGYSGSSDVMSEIPVQAAGNNVLRVNGADNATAAYSFAPLSSYKVVSVVGNSASDVKGAWAIGTGDAGWLGSIAEIITTDTAMTPEARQQAEGYLAHKWGLTNSLPIAHPYKSAAPNASSVTVNLDGTASDPDGVLVSTTWSFVSGPVGVSFGNHNAVDTTVSMTANGTYVLRLTAADGVNQTHDDITINVVAGAVTNLALTYNGNGNTGGSVPVDSSSPYDSAETVTVLGNTGSLVRTGYTFTGWNTASNGTGVSFSAGVTFSMPPANVTLYAKWAESSISAPAGLLATAVSSTQINLSWIDASGNETGFLIERSATGSTGFASLGTAAANATTYNDTMVSLGETWYYRVTATNAVELSAPSAEASTTTPKTPATVTLGSLVHTYNGSGCEATAATTPEGLTVTITYNGSATPPVNVGTYAVTGTVVNATHEGATNGMLVVNQATPVITNWPTASSILIGQALSNATLNSGSASVSGSFGYVSPTHVPPAGVYSAAVRFTPTDSVNYTNVIEVVPVTVIDIYAVPFLEPFEARNLGDLHGQYGWLAEGTFVQTNKNKTYNNSAKAAEVSGAGGYLKHSFNDARTKVWMDMRIQVVPCPTAPTPETNSAGTVYVSTNGMVMAFDGATPTETGVTVQTNTWARFTMFSDYTAKTYILYVNDVRVGKYSFYTATVPAFEYIKVGGKDTVVDDLGVTPNQPGMKYMPSLILLQ